MMKVGRKCDVTSWRKTGEMRLIQTNPESESKKQMKPKRRNDDSERGQTQGS